MRGKWAGVPIQCVFDPEYVHSLSCHEIKTDSGYRRQDDEDIQSSKSIEKSQDPAGLPSRCSKVCGKRRGDPSKGYSVLDFWDEKRTAMKTQEGVGPFHTRERSPKSVATWSNVEEGGETTEEDEATKAFWQSITGDEFVDEEVVRSHQTTLDEEVALGKNSACFRSMEMCEISGFINPTQVMVWEPLPDNAPAWKRNLFFHCEFSTHYDF